METISLKSIRFNSFDEQAKLVGEVQKDALSYWTTFVIDMLDLNKLLNLIQKNNDDSDVNDLIQTSDFVDFTEYEINFDKLPNSSIHKNELDFLVDHQLKKQIRA